MIITWHDFWLYVHNIIRNSVRLLRFICTYFIFAYMYNILDKINNKWSTLETWLMLILYILIIIYINVQFVYFNNNKYNNFFTILQNKFYEMFLKRTCTAYN